jgi:hypothetical protein
MIYSSFNFGRATYLYRASGTVGKVASAAFKAGDIVGGVSFLAGAASGTSLAPIAAVAATLYGAKQIYSYATS